MSDQVHRCGRTRVRKRKDGSVLVTNKGGERLEITPVPGSKRCIINGIGRLTKDQLQQLINGLPG